MASVIRLPVFEEHEDRVLPEYLFHYLCLDELDRAHQTVVASLRAHPYRPCRRTAGPVLRVRP